MGGGVECQWLNAKETEARKICYLGNPQTSELSFSGHRLTVLLKKGVACSICGFPFLAILANFSVQKNELCQYLTRNWPKITWRSFLVVQGALGCKQSLIYFYLGCSRERKNARSPPREGMKTEKFGREARFWNVTCFGSRWNTRRRRGCYRDLW